MLNVCWEEDTLFMIFEEDFRFEPESDDVEPVFVTASTFQEIMATPVAGASPTPVTSELRVVSLLLSDRLFWASLSWGVVLTDPCTSAVHFLYLNPPPVPSCWHV